MKKVFAVIVLMVMFVMMANVATADDFDNGCDCPYCSGNRLVRNWCKENSFNNHLNDVTIGDTHFYTGALIKDEWMHNYKEKYTFQGWLKKVEEEFGVGWMDIDEIGTAEDGTPIYRMTAVGKDGKNIKNEKAKQVDIIFVIK